MPIADITEETEYTIIQCPKCGANLNPRTIQEINICEYCGTPILFKSKEDLSANLAHEEKGYQLFWNHQLVGHEPNWTMEQSIGNFLWNKGEYPEKNVEGKFNGKPLDIPDNLFDSMPARSISVLPCFIIPKGQTSPTDQQISNLVRHLEWARSCYAELLGATHTFMLEASAPKVISTKNDLSFYKGLKNKEAHFFAGEMLNALGFNRYNCPYVCFTVIQNESEDFPTGCGQPFNGGFNTGGGIVLVSSYALNHIPNFQSTVQHELAHAFGLPHVNVYGYDMKTNPSIMSYNLSHHTKGFSASPTPGIFIPEDIRGLALNQRVFPGLQFDQNKDIPAGYSIFPTIKFIGKMHIIGQPEGIHVRTTSGESYNSKVSNIVQNIIYPSIDNGKVTYDSSTMWHSAQTKNGWVTLELTFPSAVELTGITIHSQHSGKYHAAEAVRIHTMNPSAHYDCLGEFRLKNNDQRVDFKFTKTQRLKLDLKSGQSGFVVLRGLEFFNGTEEFFSPPLPYGFGHGA